MNNTVTPTTPMFTHHGAKRKQGYPIKIHGQNAIGYFEKEQLIGYTTLDEIHQMFYGRNIPEFEID
jgi:hypothetical protein